MLESNSSWVNSTFRLLDRVPVGGATGPHQEGPIWEPLVAAWCDPVAPPTSVLDLILQVINLIPWVWHRDYRSPQKLTMGGYCMLLLLSAATSTAATAATAATATAATAATAAATAAT